MLQLLYLLFSLFFVVTHGSSCSNNNGGCEIECTDTITGPQCSCNSLSVLATDQKSCTYIDALYYTNVIGDIVFLQGNPPFSIKQSNQIISASAPDYKRKRIFYATYAGSGTDFLIFELKLNSLSARIIGRNTQGIIYDMVYDDLTNSLYMTTRDRISYILDVDASNSTVLTLVETQSPKSIDFDSELRCLFWNSFNGSISKCCFKITDCNEQIIILSAAATAPFAIVLDKASKQLIWIDARDALDTSAQLKTHRFKSSDYNGNNIVSLFDVNYTTSSSEILWNMIWIDGIIYWIKWLYTTPFEASIQKRTIGFGPVTEVKNLGVTMHYSLQYYAKSDFHSTTTTPKPCPDVCSKKPKSFTGYIADPTSPHRFIACLFGITHACMNCPSNLIYDEKLGVCNWP